MVQAVKSPLRSAARAGGRGGRPLFIGREERVVLGVLGNDYF